MSINLNRVGLRISAGQPNQFPAAPVPQVAFSGRSNVGKSSLVNCLLGRKSLARVSSAPGKTVTVNFYDIDGKLFGVLWNPEEKIEISEDQIAALHRVVQIILP